MNYAELIGAIIIDAKSDGYGNLYLKTSKGVFKITGWAEDFAILIEKVTEVDFPS